MAATGILNFMVPGSESSLFRNGKVMIDRNADGNTTESRGIELESHEVPLVNGREGSPPTWALHGFELLDAPLETPPDFLDHDTVISQYYPDCAALVREATGAEVFAFDHNLRSASAKAQGKRVAGGQDVQGPAHVVHGDYTLRSAPDRLRQLAAPPSGNDTLKGHLPDGVSLVPGPLAEQALAGGRFAIINVWRSIVDDPVVTNPMALCDGQSVAPDDLVVFEIHYADRVGENYFAKFSPSQVYYHYPEMTRDEALLIKQWDSAGQLGQTNGASGDASGGPCTFSFHSAYQHPEPDPTAPDRFSIEVRCLVIYD